MALPPGPARGIPGSQLLRFRRDPLGFLSAAAGQHGDVVRIQFGPREVVLFVHPDHVKEILVTQQRTFIKSMVLQRSRRVLGDGLLTSEGELHLRQRRLVQPAFHRARIAAYGEVMVEHALRLGAGWRDGQTLDIHAEMMRLTLGIVAKTLFDADVSADSAAIAESLNVLLTMFNRVILPFSELLDRLPLPKTRAMQRSKAYLDAIIYGFIAERRRTGEDRGDLLSMLLLSQDHEGDNAGMTDTLVHDEALTLFLAGHETTAAALTWTWYLLAQHPAVAERWRAELDAVLGGRAPTFDDLPGLAYTRMLLSESMRLYPPAWAIGRESLAPFSVGGYELPARSTVLVSPYITQRDGRWYPEPARFDPERWAPELAEARPKYAYFPFGGGTRICIGEQFAWMEGMLLLATLGQQWRFQLVPGHPVEPQPLITLRPRHGVQMRLERIKDKG
jgi:cytochrome P450